MPAHDRASERRGAPRTAVVWDVLEPILERAEGEPVLDVLDIGGGTGGSAVRVAGLGHRVRVVDPSPDALAALARRARELDVEVAGQQGDLSGLADLVEPDSVDLVLCHGVLEFVDDAAAALDAMHRVLRPGGHLSLLVAQQHAAVVARALAGHFAAARSLLEPQPQAAASRNGRRFALHEIVDLLERSELTLDPAHGTHGIRVFADLVPGSLLELEPGATAALVDLERAVSQRPEYLPLATQLHLLARG